MRKGNYTDQEIINGLIDQNNNVLLYVYKRNFRSVRHYIIQQNGTDKDAEDIFQEVMILLFHKARTGSLLLKCSFHTYLFSVAKIYWLRQLKHNEKRKFESSDFDNIISEDDNLHNDIINTERKKIFIKHFNDLTEDCQKIIKLFLNEHSITDITNLMGYSSEQHTKNRRFRCKKNLIERIQQNPHFKELTNERIGNNYQIPRW